MIEQVDRLIDIAEKVGSEAWPLLVQSTLNNALLAVVGTGIMVLFSLICSTVAYRKFKMEGDDDMVIPVAFFFILALIFAIVGVSEVPSLLCPACETAMKLVKASQ